MIILQSPGYQMLFTGDHMHTLRHLTVDDVRQITISGDATMRQVQKLRK